MRARNTLPTGQPRHRRGERLWTVAVVISCVCAIAVASSAWLSRARELSAAETSAISAEQVEIFAVHHELTLSFVSEYQTALFVDVGVLPRADLEAATSLRRSTAERLRPEIVRLSQSDDAYTMAVANELLTILQEYGNRSINTVADRFFIEAKTDELIHALFQAVETSGRQPRALRDLSVATLRFGSSVSEVSVLGAVKDDATPPSPFIDLVGGRYKNTVSRLDAAPGFDGARGQFASALDPGTVAAFDRLAASSTVQALDDVYRWWRERALAGEAPVSPDRVATGVSSFNGLTAAFFLDAIDLERDSLVQVGDDARVAAFRDLVIGLSALVLSIANLIATLVVRFGREDLLRDEIEADLLTGLGSRALFPELDARLLDEGGHPRALLHVDLDRFKPVNDVYGHQVGDALLREVGAILRAGVRGVDDQILRVGGDEFLVALHSIEGVLEAEAIAERLLDEIRKPFAIDGHEITIDASIGVSTSLRSTTLDAMMTEADLALYEAKDRGRGRVVVFDRSAKRELMYELPARLAGNDFSIEIVGHRRLDAGSSSEGAIIDPRGVDLVLGWSDANGDRISTSELLATVEWTGNGREFLDSQLAAVANQQIEHPDGVVWITPPGGLLQSDRSVVRFIADVRAAGVDASRLGVVVRDVGPSHDIDHAVSTYAALTRLGVHLALGDFGMDHSPLRALVEFPFEQVRLEADLVRSAGDTPTRAVLLAAITDVCKSLGVEVIVTTEAGGEHSHTDGAAVDLRAPSA